MKLNRETLVPLSMVVSILGGVPFLTAVYAKIETNNSDIKEMKHFQEKKEDRDISILDRLARIEEILKRIDRTSRR